MKYKESSSDYKQASIEAWKKYCNTIFPTEEDFLEHLFFTNGNGYEWNNDGCLVEGISVENNREKPAISFEEWQRKKSSPKRYIYPLCQYARCITFPKNINNDWKEQLLRALDWADTAPHLEHVTANYETKTFDTHSYEENDHKWLKVARDRLVEFGLA
jgi:hypothetical protein